MIDIWAIVALLLSLALGWILGRGMAKHKRHLYSQQSLSRDYFVGLDHLLNENTDEAIESFIRALEVNSETIPAHLALAKLFRRKGDVQRAINIHQTLLARPDLSRPDSLRIQMALAIDYDALGLLDRAENLLIDIIKQNPPRIIRKKTLTLLTRLYEKESEWQQALDTAAKLGSDHSDDLWHDLAHYCCELAEKSMLKQDYKSAATFLKQSLGFDANCVRSSFLQAKMAMQQQQWKSAVKALRQVEEQDPLFVCETIKDLRQCYTALNAPQEYEHYLRQCLAKAPSATVILALADVVMENRGVYAAGAFITDELKYRPSIKGFNRLIDLHIEYGSESAVDSLKVLRSLTGTLETSKPRYLCGHCGFSAKSLVWQCPSCKKWGSSRPIQGLEGE